MANIIWGISGMSHDAAIAVFENDKFLFASHSERYSRVKNDHLLNQELITECLKYGLPKKIIFYEKPYLKKTRQAYAGQWSELSSKSIKEHLKEFGITCDIKYISHHLSHAAGGFYTSKFNNAIVVCLDAIGEWETFTIWKANKLGLKKVFSQLYPHSIGLWYSAMTQRIGLKPQEEEYILMGMSCLGDPKKYYDVILKDFFLKIPNKNSPTIKFRENLHKGCLDWRNDLATEQDRFDIAAAVQKIYEDIFEGVVTWCKGHFDEPNLIISGGCALNCVANTLAFKYYKNVWIMPNPGDAGSSVGCVLADLNKHISWSSLFLGHSIGDAYPTDAVISELLTNKIVGVASGRAEFGPRALGNRSILADPRGADVKDRVNSIKKREKFRPFAPMVLKEFVNEYFDVPDNFENPYMQFAVPCKHPEQFPAIVHYDNTSRVQTVDSSHADIHGLLTKWHSVTGCPILLNTSLNIKGEPLINSKEDVQRWCQKYDLKILS